MRAAFNIGLYYEMKDNPATAIEWVEKADKLATTVIGINALLGIFGTVLSGWFSDKFFKGKRNMPAFIFGVLNTIALTLFLLGGDSLVLNVISMILFGIAIGVLICFSIIIWGIKKYITKNLAEKL